MIHECFSETGDRRTTRTQTPTAESAAANGRNESTNAQAHPIGLHCSALPSL
jgi:hypothetical protein